MPFVDGWAHECGATVFDDAGSLTWAGGDGELSRHLQTLYTNFSDSAVLAARLNASAVEAMNLELQGVQMPNLIMARHTLCVRAKKANCTRDGLLYSDWQPRRDFWPNGTGAGDMMGFKGAVSVLNKEEMRAKMDEAHDYSNVRQLLIQDPLHTFYEAIYSGDCGISPHNPHPRAALGCLLPAAATLYATLAELHPFVDGNSRTRLMVLQTQLARAGAHPVVLYNNGWAPYHMNSLEELEEYLLGGYCAWEYVNATGKSPYAGHAPSFDCATPPEEDHRDMQRMGANASPIRLYDPKQDTCLVPPPSAPVDNTVTDKLRQATDKQRWTLNHRASGCPSGRRNADADECLHAIEEAVVGIYVVDAFKVLTNFDNAKEDGWSSGIPSGCSYSDVTQRAIFNHNQTSTSFHDVKDNYRHVCTNDDRATGDTDGKDTAARTLPSPSPSPSPTPASSMVPPLWRAAAAGSAFDSDLVRHAVRRALALLL